MLNAKSLEKDFIFLSQKFYDKSIVFLDTASSAQKPKAVIDAVSLAYSKGYANIHRGSYSLSYKANESYENVRNIVKSFINAQYLEEIIFTKGATESINLVAYSLLTNYFQFQDEIIITEMEHHSNIVPWHIIANYKKLVIKYIPIDDNGDLVLDKLSSLITAKTKIIALTHCSNVLGIINPIKDVINIAHNYNIPVLIDGAQSVVHQSVDIQSIDCDFFVFSAHKLYSTTGVGVLYIKKKWHDIMSPHYGGGGMIDHVSMNGTTFTKSPYKFEAGTPNIVGVIGLGAAINYINKLNFKNIILHEQNLLNYTNELLCNIKGLSIIGNNDNKSAIVSFVVNGYHSHDINTLLDLDGICIRSGHHCAQPILQHYNLSSVLRVSFGIYNTTKDIDKLVLSLDKALNLLKKSM